MGIKLKDVFECDSIGCLETAEATPGEIPLWWHVDEQNRAFCQRCWPRHRCLGCGQIKSARLGHRPDGWVRVNGKLLCNSCGHEEVDKAKILIMPYDPTME